MTAPKKYPYKRRPPKSDKKRRQKRSATTNPYVFVPDESVYREKTPVNPFRSVANRKPKPPQAKIVNKQRHFRHFPIFFAENILKIRPWKKQQHILKSIAHRRRVAVRSCNGAGKTFTAAVVILWWLMSYDDAIVITTAPSERQVREILWRELRNLYMPVRDKIGGKLTRTRLEFGPKRYAYGFSTNTEDRFQGFHSGNILVIVDEASGVDEFIFNAIRGVITAKNSKLLLIGNPHGYAGTFYDAFHKNRKQFATIHISAFDLPAFKAADITEENIKDIDYHQPDEDYNYDPDEFDDDDEPEPVQQTLGLSSPQWALDLFHDVGPQSSVYQTRVLGQFPEEADDTLIPLRDIEHAVKRLSEIPPDTKPVMGVDVARFGNDKTVIIIRHGPRVIYIDELRKSDIVNTTGAVVTAALKYKLQDIIVDEIGVGAGVLDNLRADKRFNAQGLNGSNKPSNTELYLNRRAEVFDGLRQRFADGDISIPNDPELISQIASLTYKYNARGQLQLESKDQIRSNGRQSPDKADAIALAFTTDIKSRPRKSIKFFTAKSLARLRYHQRHDPRWRD